MIMIMIHDLCLNLFGAMICPPPDKMDGRSLRIACPSKLVLHYTPTTPYRVVLASSTLQLTCKACIERSKDRLNGEEQNHVIKYN